MIRRLLSTSILAAACVGCTPPSQHAWPYDPPIGPQASSPPGYGEPGRGDALGDVWEIEEVSTWQAIWLRRDPGSRFFDGYWTHSVGERIRGSVEISVNGRSVTAFRRHGDGQECRYDGEIDATSSMVSGRYSCTWARAPMHFTARIIRLRDVAPRVLRDR
jgi:hypothetical protein